MATPTQTQQTTKAAPDALSRIAATKAAYLGSKQVSERLSADIDRIVLTAISEDLGVDSPNQFNESLFAKDVTSAGICTAATPAKAVMLVKAPGVVAGLDIAARVFTFIEPTAKVHFQCQEGAVIEHTPSPIASIEGSARGILLAERTALNLIQRLSGIATVSRTFAEKAAPYGITIVDTRKTTPGLRALEKYAVQVGGAGNHRYGLFDAVLIKDNHIQIAGGVTAAIQSSRKAHPELPVEVEVTNFDQLNEALALKAEKILVDNMTPDQIRQAVDIVAGRALIEVSGGVNAANLDSYLIKGIDAISIGALTHSVRSLDISLEIEV